MALLNACSQQADEEQAQAESPSSLTFDAVYDAAMAAMGAGGVTRLEYRADGWEACLGQPWRISEGWARWEITDYARVIDYAAFNSVQTAQRRAGLDPEMLGGCGAQPDASPQNQQSSVNADSSWEQQLQVWLTPMGFLSLAQENGAQVSNGGGGVTVGVDVNRDGVAYHLDGDFGEDSLLDRIVTHIDNPVYGDMAFEAAFSDYRDFGGLQFPARIVQKQGGFATLDLTVSEVIPNTTAAAEPPARQGGGGGGGQQPADLPAFEAIGEGVFALHGAYQSVAVEFADYAVVIDGLQSDSRAQEIISTVKQAIPGKPIAYVISTHNHFDHASGLRAFVAEGASIITHQDNVEFFTTALSAPRTLNAAAPTGNGMPVQVVGVEEFYALDDGTQRVEVLKINGSRHADDILIAYIPAIKTVVEADLLQPWINPFFGGSDHPFVVEFLAELDRLVPDYAQFVPVHRPPAPPLMTREDLE